MTPAAVRFDPAAAQEAESAYDWFAARNPSAAHGFREKLRYAVDAVADSHARGPAMETGRGDMSSRDFPSSWFTGCAGTKSKSWPWLTVDDGRATGGCDSDPPSNFRMQRRRGVPAAAFGAFGGRARRWVHASVTLAERRRQAALHEA
jgi:plasmid stabilization system protein ParE